MPDLFLTVYIEGNDYEQRAFAPMFSTAWCNKATSPDEADFVVFTGGDDVDPQLYGEERHQYTSFSVERDRRDLALYAHCLKEGIPMFGVCRGAQFLWVMNGGKLYQDVDNHYDDHSMYDPVGKRYIKKISSSHHQMCMNDDSLGAVIRGISGVSTERYLTPTVSDVAKTHKDIEAFWFPKTACFGVQGHPEYGGYNEYMQWCLFRIEEYFTHNPDICLLGKYRRLREDLRTAEETD